MVKQSKNRITWVQPEKYKNIPTIPTKLDKIQHLWTVSKYHASPYIIQGKEHEEFFMYLSEAEVYAHKLADYLQKDVKIFYNKYKDEHILFRNPPQDALILKKVISPTQSKKYKYFIGINTYHPLDYTTSLKDAKQEAIRKMKILGRTGMMICTIDGKEVQHLSSY